MNICSFKIEDVTYADHVIQTRIVAHYIYPILYRQRPAVADSSTHDYGIEKEVVREAALLRNCDRHLIRFIEEGGAKLPKDRLLHPAYADLIGIVRCLSNRDVCPNIR